VPGTGSFQATAAGYQSPVALKVMQNEVDGWDVVREDEDRALSNHPTKEEAIAAAEIRSDEERVNDAGDTPVEVTPSTSTRSRTPAPA